MLVEAQMRAVNVNGRRYQLPQRPTVIICYDGCDPAYVRRGIADGVMSNTARMAETGFLAYGQAVVPTFTNPNNVSIVTGVTPAVHGISGNYVLDRMTGERLMITDGRMMRCGTILAALADAGVKVAVITAKDKLLRMLARDLHGIAFSSEYADRATKAANGIADVEAMVGRSRPDQYSADLSLFVLEAGLHLLKSRQADLLYLSLSDYVQHGWAPGEPEADAFNRKVDQLIGEMTEVGALVGFVADHGMNDKARPDGSPNVIYLQEELNASFGDGAASVICPITDPFVRHHGALGSFVRVYVNRGELSAMMDETAKLPGIDVVLDGRSAAGRFDLPADLEGDFIALGDAGTVIGATPADHELSGLSGRRLRSHGGLAEQLVPFALSRPLNERYAELSRTKPLRNFDIFDYALNGTL
jgi:phosphonoacetate hydrolase